MEEYQPPRGRVLGLLALAAALGVLVFSLLLWFQLRTVRPLDPADYPETLPDFTFSANCTQVGNHLELTGRMGVRGEWYTSFDGRIVLYLAETDTYWMVPTAMDEQAAFDSELVEKTWGESYGGFEARLPLSALDADPSQYELCVAWRSNGHNALVHTGQILEVE